MNPDKRDDAKLYLIVSILIDIVKKKPPPAVTGSGLKTQSTNKKSGTLAANNQPKTGETEQQGGGRLRDEGDVVDQEHIRTLVRGV